MLNKVGIRLQFEQSARKCLAVRNTQKRRFGLIKVFKVESYADKRICNNMML